MKRFLRTFFGVALATGLCGLAYIFATTGTYGLNVVWRHSGLYWPAVAPNDSRLTPSMQLALSGHRPEVRAGALSWTDIRPGFAVAELSVLAQDHEVDRLLLAKIDPQRFRFAVASHAAGNWDLDDWINESHAALVITGPYFDQRGMPGQPFLSNGQSSGPSQYSATHGAFIASDHSADVIDLAGKDWQQVFAGADNAFVSFPMLIGAEGESRATSSPWLANRSFIGRDVSGNIVLGTTKDAFFSLDRFALFLRSAPLHLTSALNLDGGGTCQGIVLGSYRRDFCGDLELKQDSEGRWRLLRRGIGERRLAMPIVIQVFPE